MPIPLYQLPEEKGLLAKDKYAYEGLSLPFRWSLLDAGERVGMVLGLMFLCLGVIAGIYVVLWW